MLNPKIGRPADIENRTESEIRAYDFLDSLGVEYSRIDHEPAFNMEICGKIDKSLGAMICKNLFLTNRQKTEYYLLMMPASKKFKTKELSKALGVARLSFADSDRMLELLGVLPGSAGVLSLLNDSEGKIKAVVDEDVLKEPYFGCHPCVNTSSLKIKTSDLKERIMPALKHSLIEVRLLGED